ncbi:MAG: DUF2721 domain-containing protein [Bacteroidales bacterium]
MLELNSVDLIQAMLAPGLMISACGLLLLGIHNKYGIVVGRIRALEEEKRRLIPGYFARSLDEFQLQRMNSIRLQVGKFEYRLKLIRNTVFFYTIAVALFVLSSLFIGISQIINSEVAQPTALILFLLGMISVFTGIIHAAKEVWKGYEIVKIEVKESEYDEQ